MSIILKEELESILSEAIHLPEDLDALCQGAIEDGWTHPDWTEAMTTEERVADLAKRLKKDYGDRSHQTKKDQVEFWTGRDSDTYGGADLGQIAIADYLGHMDILFVNLLDDQLGRST